MKKLFLIGALSASLFIQANNEEISKPEESKKLDGTKTFTVYCKYNNYQESIHDSATFEEMLEVANMICAKDKPGLATELTQAPQ
ncbi:hypothetical protein [Flavobacterium sp. NRK F7]|uniref:hypothetical protein n=1 Tax=Flavobacterium sp. NRK F7 TaxID=2954930 RepID=UPI0020905B9C|nr:hypothetical protein [Flavobacterium sp. NRK F7]MCO6161459.1 hypothetical protein [Flavobacterium sp. NRK F7]